MKVYCNLKQKFSFFAFVFILSALLTGCTSHTASIVNTKELDSMIKSKEAKNNTDYETVRLSNGVVMYTDKTNTPGTSSSEEIDNSPVNIKFGPSDLNFDFSSKIDKKN